MDELISLFPTPFLRAPGVLPRPLVDGLIQYFVAQAKQDNNTSPGLTHTQMLKPGDSPLFIEAAELITPKLVDFGVQLFGERMGWALKEMWVNVLDTGGHQAMHNHANSFISGVVYLTRPHLDSRTVFMKSPSGTEYSFKNDHVGVATGPYNSERWVSMAPEPGDLILFPSYLMHAVPPNPGERRVSMAFNAIPSRLNSWGYAVSFNG